jgi:hypothetical protein
MKKIILLLFTIIFLFSCSDSDNTTTETSSTLIVGKWKLLQIGYLVNGQEELENYTNLCGLSYDVEFFDTNLFQTYGCNPNSTPPISQVNGNYVITTINGNSNLFIDYPESSNAVDSNSSIKQIDNSNLKLHTLSSDGNILIRVFEKVNN